ncbi:hypothetical protein KNP414_02193 [Paenibacillus mucilaginosus KNP414]|uniref:Uncharacterized protein n=1 Tax=Paenibacillus mucilaginosus (strain KNP414) TaxID=1036673 RepID=F8F524_PAEMK|nr:hypothetical protein KNP414_02193 [Paenibacillus mucilaginosus KNP414]
MVFLIIFPSPVDNKKMKVYIYLKSKIIELKMSCGGDAGCPFHSN